MSVQVPPDLPAHDDELDDATQRDEGVPVGEADAEADRENASDTDSDADSDADEAR